MSHDSAWFAKLRLPAAVIAMLTASTCAGLAIYDTTRPVASTKLTLDSPSDAPAPIANFTPAEAVATAALPEGAKLSVFAAEPHVSQPIAMAFDERGRLWVAECHSYQYAVNGAPPAQAVDRIIVFEDADGDGRHDKRTVFAEGLKNLSSLEIGWGGVWACCAPNLLFFPDADHDARPDGRPVVVLDGFDAQPELSWHLPNHLLWGPDGKLYGCSGFSSRSKPAKPGTPDVERTALDAGVWRVDPQTHEFEVVARGTCNPWGIDYDSAGRLFVSNNIVDHLWQIRFGGHYTRSQGSLEAHIYEAMGSCVDHHHWAGTDPWDHGRSEKVGGGHAHSGLLIYQGGAWSDIYREAVLIGNLHGRRICADRFDHAQGIAIAHHDVDLLRMNDPGFRCIDIKCGPDGQLYLCDWNALGECHSTDDEAAGRIYRLAFPTEAQKRFDLAAESPDELLHRQTHRNDWFARQARTRLHHLAAQGKTSPELAEQAWSQAGDRKRSTVERLRSLWTWNLIVPQARRAEAIELAGDPDAAMRSWALRISVESDPASPKVAAALVAGVKGFSEPEFLAEASSLAGRLPAAARRELLAVLLPKLNDDLPRDQQRLAWYALEPILLDDLSWSTEQILKTPGSFLAAAATRRFAEAWAVKDSEFDQAMLIEPIAKLLNATAEPKLVAARIVGLRDGAAGSEKPVPEAWLRALRKSAESAAPEIRSATDSLAWEILFAERGGDGAPSSEALLSAAIAAAASRDTPQARRSAALTYCLERRGEVVYELLLQLIDEEDPLVACRAIRGLAAFDERNVPKMLLERWNSWDAQRRSATLEVLASRGSFADYLITALEIDRLQPIDVPADVAARLATIDGGRYVDRVDASWGSIRPLREALEKELGRLRTLLSKSGRPDVEAGAELFTKKCSACHNFKQQRRGWGPALDGVQRDNVDYWLLHVLDPSAVVPTLFRNVVVELDDGRTLSGFVAEETPAGITLRSPSGETKIAKPQITRRTETTESVMPFGLLNGLGDAEVRNLFGYLMR